MSHSSNIWNCTWFQFNGWWSAHVCGYGTPPPTVNPRAPQSLLSLLHTCSQSHQQWMTRGPPERPQERVKLSQSLYPLLKIQTPRHAALPSLIYLKLDSSAQMYILYIWHRCLPLITRSRPWNIWIVKQRMGTFGPPLFFWDGEPFGLRFLPPTACCVWRG